MQDDKYDAIALFADGELCTHSADIIRAHLDNCEGCRDALVKYNTITARLSTMAVPAVQQLLGESVDHMVHLIVGMEQQAVFALYSSGVSFTDMHLYRIIDPMEQGIIINGEKAAAITMKWPTFPEMIYTDSPIAVMLELKFFPPYEHLNKRR
jgi:hypothetical protein